MAKSFINENFLLETEQAQKLYHDYACKLPIIDYHCHLVVDEVANNRKFENLTQIWLNGDHYKWRAMRANGVNEDYITGKEKSDWEKFYEWAKTVPVTLRNPLYHWTHMELKKPFGITDRLLNGDTAKSIWDECNELLVQDNFSARGLMRQFNVEAVCSTDDPVDNLEHHKAIKESGFEIKVLPTFRPDKAMAIDNPAVFYPWFTKLQELTSFEIKTFAQFIEAIKLRHDYFHENGCRLSDHGIDTAWSTAYTSDEIENIFTTVLAKGTFTALEIEKFKSAALHEFGIMNAERGWVQQLHMGALRNNNAKMFRKLGPDAGYDSMGDYEVAKPLAKYLSNLADKDKLTKTILYNLNPRDNELLATMTGNFQDGITPGKMQFGSGWWFLDQKDGMEKQLNALSVLGLLGRFVGMLTDSRSFLSYPRHEYFRRILCGILGREMKSGLIPDDISLVSPMVENICYYNAKNYFNF